MFTRWKYCKENVEKTNRKRLGLLKLVKSCKDVPSDHNFNLLYFLFFSRGHFMYSFYYHSAVSNHHSLTIHFVSLVDVISLQFLTYSLPFHSFFHCPCLAKWRFWAIYIFSFIILRYTNSILSLSLLFSCCALLWSQSSFLESSKLWEKFWYDKKYG